MSKSYISHSTDYREAVGMPQYGSFVVDINNPVWHAGPWHIQSPLYWADDIEQCCCESIQILHMNLLLMFTLTYAAAHSPWQRARSTDSLAVPWPWVVRQSRHVSIDMSLPMDEMMTIWGFTLLLCRP